MEQTFSAGSSALGYIYQARYALLLLLQAPEEASLSIERFDDVAFEQSGTPTELLQLKHHLKINSTLTDSSPDLWRTIRIWSSKLAQGNLLLPETRLVIVTTSGAPAGSIASLLKPDVSRNTQVAHDRLVSIAQTSANQSLAPAFSTFLDLSERERLALVDNIDVLDNSPQIGDAGLQIRACLQLSVRHEYLEALFERLEGWWFGKVVQHLSGLSVNPLYRYEVHEKIFEIADGFKPDALPIDFLDIEPPTDFNLGIDERLFILQLRAISVQSKRIEKAIRDYYRAFEQRSRWVRDELLIGQELELYENKLVDEWERFVLALEDEVTELDQDELRWQRLGRRIFTWMDQTADFRIRPLVTEAYVMRGSYHILADCNPPRVWWHPKFFERLQSILQIPEVTRS